MCVYQFELKKEQWFRVYFIKPALINKSFLNIADRRPQRSVGGTQMCVCVHAASREGMSGGLCVYTSAVAIWSMQYRVMEPVLMTPR